MREGQVLPMTGLHVTTAGAIAIEGEDKPMLHSILLSRHFRVFTVNSWKLVRLPIIVNF